MTEHPSPVLDGPGPAPIWRPWHPVTTSRDRFGWLLGLQVALAFAGPAVVAHLGGLEVADAALMSLAGLLFALVASSLPSGPTRLLSSASIVAALGAAGAVAELVPLHSPAGVIVLVAAAVGAAFAPAISSRLAAPVRTFAIGLVVLGAVVPSRHATAMLVAGALVAWIGCEAARLLAHPRVPSPRLPAPAPPTALTAAATRTHALRLGVAVGLCGCIALAVGTGSAFAAHASWATIGVWVALRPHHHLTRDLALQRVAGTVAGAALTVAVVAAYPSSVWLGWLLVPLVFAAFGLRSVNYAWYCVAVTPVIVIGFTGAGLDGEVLAARIAWTALGVAVAYALVRVPWPRSGAAPAPATV